jgi:hypothetical protein
MRFFNESTDLPAISRQLGGSYIQGYLTAAYSRSYGDEVHAGYSRASEISRVES